MENKKKMFSLKIILVVCQCRPITFAHRRIRNMPLYIIYEQLTIVMSFLLSMETRFVFVLVISIVFVSFFSFKLFNWVGIHA